MFAKKLTDTMDSLAKAAATLTTAGQLLVEGMNELRKDNERREARLQELEQRVARSEQNLEELRDVQAGAQQTSHALDELRQDLQARLDQADQRCNDRFSGTQESIRNAQDEATRKVQ